MKQTVVLLAIPFLLAAPQATAQEAAYKAVMQNGNPAIQCHGPGPKNGGHLDWIIVRVDLNGRTALRFPLDYDVRGGGTRASLGNHGLLFVMADRIVLQPSQEKPGHSTAFDESRSGVVWSIFTTSRSIRLRSSGKGYIFGPDTDWYDISSYPPCSALLDLAFSDFPAAEKQFNQLIKGLLPRFGQGWQDFQKQAATWRALPTKPALSDDVTQHRLLAEDALQEKKFDLALDEYEAGLDIDPLWPAGHFNAAMVSAELKDYENAIFHMRCYLELAPDAPDARQAHDQLLLWQGKLKQQQQN